MQRRSAREAKGSGSARNLRTVVTRVLDQYLLDLRGPHGIAHWARVLENGRRLAGMTGASVAVVELFAVLHDACRHNDGRDPEHGPRGAELARSLNGDLFHLSREDAEDLYTACSYHTTGRRDGPVTVQTCWDADRLDLGRVGIRPLPERLCTEAARGPKVLRWGWERGKDRIVPAWVRPEWGRGPGE